MIFSLVYINFKLKGVIPPIFTCESFNTEYRARGFATAILINSILELTFGVSLPFIQVNFKSFKNLI